MDTRQLAAFCAVVERRSFSQAAERLGVTQPAVSLQVRALEKRLGTQLLDRSGRRVEPTEAGLRLYRGAQRMLAARGADARRGRRRTAAARSRGRLSTRRFDRARRRSSCPCCSASSSGGTPTCASRSRCHDTQTVVELVADRGLELGIVGAARRHRGRRASSRSSRDEVILDLPARPPLRGPHGRPSTSCAAETLILMQEGAGVRQVVEDELRALGRAAARLSTSALELGLQESVRSAVQAGYGVTFISRTAVESGSRRRDARRGASAGDEREAGDLARARAPGRAQTRAADAFVAFVARGGLRLAADALAYGLASVWAAPTTRRRLTTPVTWPSSSITGRWRKPCSSITRAASSTSVSAGGGDRVDRHPLAHRAPRSSGRARRHRLEQVALGEDPDQACRSP